MKYKLISVSGDEIKIKESCSNIVEQIDGRTFNLLYKYGIRFYSSSSPIIQQLNRTKAGTCIYLRINLNRQKVVYVGKRGDTFVFYDGSGEDGFIEIKSRYILKSSNLYIDFDCEQDKELQYSLKDNIKHYL